jgi:hypothetical protein
MVGRGAVEKVETLSTFYNPRWSEGTRWQGALSTVDAMEIHFKHFIGFRERR